MGWAVCMVVGGRVVREVQHELASLLDWTWGGEGGVGGGRSCIADTAYSMLYADTCRYQYAQILHADTSVCGYSSMRILAKSGIHHCIRILVVSM